MTKSVFWCRLEQAKKNKYDSILRNVFYFLPITSTLRDMYDLMTRPKKKCASVSHRLARSFQSVVRQL